MEDRERDLEASSLFLVAEMLECGRYSLNGRKCHPDHIARLRNVAARISLEIEEARLRRDIEVLDGAHAFLSVDAEGYEPEGREVSVEPMRSSIPVYSDSVLMRRYMELDQCQER